MRAYTVYVKLLLECSTICGLSVVSAMLLRDGSLVCVTTHRSLSYDRPAGVSGPFISVALNSGAKSAEARKWHDLECSVEK